MKRVLLFLLTVMFSVFCMAQQQKKVAVWETRCSDKSITPFQSTMVRGGMEAAVANAPGFIGYDRASFDAIMKEHNFQRSGSVKDSDIKRLGEMAGVQYIIVPEANADGDDFYIIVKMLDVETGEFGAAFDALCGSTAAEIRKACSELGVKLLGNNVDSSHSSTGRSSSLGADVITITVNGVSFEMVKVEAGSFIMGCTSEQGNDCWEEEVPFHRVTITQDYYIGKYEVTQELWQAVMGTNPSYFKAYGLPVENVSWNDVQEFCSELSRMTGRRFRLPTEAEWEYAARGGKKSTNAKYSGSSSAADVAWTVDNSGHKTHSVGKLRPNELGLYDMSGNVGEYCQDWFGDYSSASQTDPKGPTSCSVGSYHIFRGGSFIERAESCRVCWRFFHKSDDRFLSEGLRLVLEQ